jgi:hypothetical protein
VLSAAVKKRGFSAPFIRPEVLEQTYGARMEVLEHLGIRVVVDERPEHVMRVQP